MLAQSRPQHRLSNAHVRFGFPSSAGIPAGFKFLLATLRHYIWVARNAWQFEGLRPDPQALVKKIKATFRFVSRVQQRITVNEDVHVCQLRKELINAVGERKVSAVQALSPIKYHLQFKRSSDRHAAEINGIAFRGVQLTLLPAYEEVKSVFVEKAPLQMQDNYLYEALAPYGRVIGVQHLTIEEFPSVRSGTRRVSMVVTKAIPRIINIGGFPVVFNYRGQPTQCYVCQEVGHARKDCPRSRQGRKLDQQKQQQNLPKTTGKDTAHINNNKSKNKAINNNKPALGHDDLKIKLDGGW